MIRSLTLLAALAGVAAAASLEDGVALKQAGDHAGAEQVFSALIASGLADPLKAQVLAERATVRGWQQKYDEALADWAEAIRLNPQQTEWRAGQSRVLYWKGDLAKALTAIDQAITLRPTDPALWELKGDIARADGQRSVADAAYREADRLLPNGTAATKLAAGDWTPTAWRIDAYALVDTYSTERGNEPGFSLTAGYRHLPLDTGDLDWYVQGGVARIDHFSFIDVTSGGEAGVQLLTHLQIHAGGTVTPHADFEPQWRAFGGVEVMVVPQATLLLDVTHSDYSNPQQQVLGVLPGLRLEPVQWLTLEGRAISSTDHLEATATTAATTDHTWGWQAKATLNLGRFHPYVAYAAGNEPERPLPAAETSAVWGGVVFDLSRTLALRVDAAYEDRVDTYYRTSLGGGVSIRF